MDKAAWIGNSRKYEKPWGYEIVWTTMENLQGKELHIDAGKRTSLKYHTNKDEVLYLMSGTAKVEYADEAWLRYSNVEITDRNVFHIQVGHRYSTRRLTDHNSVPTQVQHRSLESCNRQLLRSS